MRRRGLQCGADARGHLGRNIGCGGVVNAEIGQVAADAIERRQQFPGGPVGANPLAQRCGRGVIEQARLQVGKQFGRDRLVARLAAHRCPRRLCHALTQASLHHERLDDRVAVTVPQVTH